jgi:hypothetical protein
LLADSDFFQNPPALACKTLADSANKMALKKNKKEDKEPWYFVLAKIVSIPAFIISLWNLFLPYFSSLHIKVLPESQIQIMEGILQDKPTTAFNVLFTVLAEGPDTKWETYKFISATLTTPNGAKINYTCRSYLEEKGMGQENASRNVPVSVNGNSSKTHTVGFQSNDFKNWVIGHYVVAFEIKNAKQESLKCSRLEFDMTEKVLRIAQRPDAILMLPCEIK